MVTISNSTIRQNVFETLYDTLKAHATASSYGTSTQPTITAAYIDDDESFPQIVVHPIMIEKESPVFDRSRYSQAIKVIIDIYTLGNKDRDILGDDVDALISPLKISGITLIDYTDINSLEQSNENKVRNKVISISYTK